MLITFNEKKVVSRRSAKLSSLEGITWATKVRIGQKA